MQRKKTLLKEYEEKGRAGGVLDKRFGENDPTTSLEERMLERFTKERQRASKGAAFNLEDEEDLTHYGQSLSKLDDFDNVGFSLEDEVEDNRGIYVCISLANNINEYSQDKLTVTLSKGHILAGSVTMNRRAKRMRFVFCQFIYAYSKTCFLACEQKIKGRGHGRSHGQEQGAQGLLHFQTYDHSY